MTKALSREFITVMLVFLAYGGNGFVLYGGFHFPLFGYLSSSYDSESLEDVALTFPECHGDDCLNMFPDEDDNNLEGIVLNFGVKNNCSTTMEEDKIALSNEEEPTNEIETTTVLPTTTTAPYDDVVDNVLYQDMPSIVFISFMNDQVFVDEDVQNDADEVSSAELKLNIDRAVKALADFFNSDESEEVPEWTADSEFEEPKRVVEDGYIFYDMGSQE